MEIPPVKCNWVTLRAAILADQVGVGNRLRFKGEFAVTWRSGRYSSDA